MANKRYTPEEDRIICNAVKNSAGNILQGIRNAAAETGRSEKALSYRWYVVLSKKEGNICFVTVSSHKSVNRKNSAIAPVLKASIWDKILKLLGKTL